MVVPEDKSRPRRGPMTPEERRHLEERAAKGDNLAGLLLTAPQAVQAGEYPPLPEWAKQDDLGGLVPSEIRSAMRAYADATCALRAARVSPAEKTARMRARKVSMNNERIIAVIVAAAASVLCAFAINYAENRIKTQCELVGTFTYGNHVYDCKKRATS